MGERWVEPGCDGFIRLQSAFISTIWRAPPGNLHQCIQFHHQMALLCSKMLQRAGFSFFFLDALQHWTQQWILFLCYLPFDCDIWAMNSICWGESEVVLKRHFSARLQSCKILNQKHFALKAACIWKDQLPQPCAVCSIRYVVQIQVG